MTIPGAENVTVNVSTVGVDEATTFTFENRSESGGPVLYATRHPPGPGVKATELAEHVVVGAAPT